MIEEKQHGQFLKSVYRKMGYKLAYYLDKNTEVTPNQLTLFRLLLNQMGVLLIAFSTNRFSLFLAGILLFAWRALDATDGCLAQIQNKQTLVGDWLDTVLDRYGYTCMFCSLSVYMYHVAPTQHLMTLIPVISIGLFFSIGLNFITRSGYGLETNGNTPDAPDTADTLTISQKIFSNIAAYSDNSVIFIVLGSIFNFLYSAAIWLGAYLAAAWIYIFLKTLQRLKQTSTEELPSDD